MVNAGTAKFLASASTFTLGELQKKEHFKNEHSSTAKDFARAFDQRPNLGDRRLDVLFCLLRISSGRFYYY